ncbi:MAG: hypothetical protein WD357_00540 [Gracilimonas sp.]
MEFNWVKIIRWLAFFPLALIVMWLIEKFFLWSIHKVFSADLNFIKFSLVLTLFGGLVAGLFANVFILTISICPNKKVGGYFISILSLLVTISLLYSIWILPYIFTFSTIYFCVLASFYILLMGVGVFAYSYDVANNH